MTILTRGAPLSTPSGAGRMSISAPRALAKEVVEVDVAPTLDVVAPARTFSVWVCCTLLTRSFSVWSTFCGRLAVTLLSRPSTGSTAGLRAPLSRALRGREMCLGRRLLRTERPRVPAAGHRRDGRDAVLCRVPSARRTRVDHAVELPDVADRAIRGACAPRRHHGRREARECLAAIRSH